jgi:hypothetical protein
MQAGPANGQGECLQDLVRRFLEIARLEHRLLQPRFFVYNCDRRVIMKALFCTALLLLSTVAIGQKDKSQRPSPPASTQCSFADGKNVSIDYSRPSMKGRKIWGGLVPFDQEWRLGANEATTFVIDTTSRSVPL